MTIDAGLKPEGAPERSPIAGAGAPLLLLSHDFHRLARV